MTEAVRGKFLRDIETLRWDLWLAVTTIGLVICGVVMVYSASAASDNAHKFLFGQARWALLGLIAMGVLMRVDYHHYERPALIYTFLGVCAALLLTVFAFPRVNGAHRWMNISGFSAQPSELAKLGVIVFLAWFLTQREEEGQLNNFWHTLAPAVVVIGVIAGLIVKEPDLGTTAMIGLVFAVLVFASGMRLTHLLKLVPLLMVVGYLFVMKVGWRRDRILTFLNPGRDPLGTGYQVNQSLIAIGSGGVNGLGFGESKQKMNFLPEPQSDFIFSVIGEELGLVGAVTLVLVFGFFLSRGLRACRRAPDKFGSLLAVGITTMIVAQAFFNISVTLSLVPTKGIPLPFISAGGSSLLVTLAAVGILLNVSEQGES